MILWTDIGASSSRADRVSCGGISAPRERDGAREETGKNETREETRKHVSLSLSLSLSLCVCVCIYIYIHTYRSVVDLFGYERKQGGVERRSTCDPSTALGCQGNARETTHLPPKQGKTTMQGNNAPASKTLPAQKRRGMERKDASFSSSKPCIPEEERNGKERCKFCPFFCFSQITTWQNQTGVIQSASLVRISKHLVICDL